jgi:dephospho-CoA kinase
MILIGLVGSKGVGKDTAADFLVKKYDFVSMAYADPLKEACRVVFNLTTEQLHDRAKKEEAVEPWGMSPRRILQTVGTDLFRNRFHKDVWLRNLEHRVRASRRDRIVVTDVRFENEMEHVRSLGGFLVRIDRETGSSDGHESEKVPVLGCDAVVDNNGSVAALHDRLKEVVGPLLRRN